jgi:molybdopterin-guanine dinucleotide biosynthesis protein B
MPKLEVYRAANGKPLLHPEDEHIVAVATDVPLATRLPQLGLDQHAAIARFILDKLKLAKGTKV